MMALLVVMTAAADTFTGRVVDEAKAPVPFVNVVLLNASDSAFVAGTTTDGDGAFTLTGNAAKPLIKITYLCYKTLVLDAPGSNLGTITLEPEATVLGEVVVKGQRPAFKLTTEGLKTEVENTLLSKVGTAKAVLEKRSMTPRSSRSSSSRPSGPRARASVSTPRPITVWVRALMPHWA